MKPTKKIEAAVLDVYHKWLHSYLNGDVKTYDSYFDNAFHFIGSTDNEEFLNRKDTTNFFKVTAEQLSGKSQVRNETKIVEQFGELIIITHLFDAWFLNGEDWNYYGRFRFSNILEKNKDGWHFVYQHYSTPDGKAQDGETIGLDQISKENLELREAIKRRTIELEEKNRELEIEGALERIRAKALAMNASEDLLDVVVILRTEFLKLGHEAQYFWHMMWLPDKYEKAMTFGDGTRIGMVMELPRHIHGKIPMLANWEKSTDPMVIYAMDAEAAIDYVDKMIALGNFQQVDPQAPTHDDIRHIGGLTFIMARTTHGEIGYSLPGVVAHPPKEDLEILVKFAGAFDLAHRRFLDLQKSEKQAREVQIELALEWVRARTMAMQKSEELADVATILFQQVKELGIQQWTCGFNIWEIGDTEFTFYPGGPDGEILPSCKVPLLEHPIFKQFDESKRRGDELFVYEKEGEIQKDHYKYMHSLPGIGDMLQGMLDSGLEFPEYQIDHVVNFAYGNMIFITYEPLPEMHNVFKRFAKVFEQTYTRFLDLQKAEAQARKAQIENALEKVRSRSLAMHNSKELQEVITTVLQQLNGLDLAIDSAVVVLPSDNEQYYTGWISSFDFEYSEGFKIPYSLNSPVHNDFEKALQTGNTTYSKMYSNEEKNLYYNELFQHSDFKKIPQERKDFLLSYDKYGASIAVCKHSGIITLSYSGKILNQEEIDVLQRFSLVFEQAYVRFLDLQKAESQAREAQIETALERIRSRSMAMQKSSELLEAGELLWNEITKLGIECFTSGYVLIDDKEDIGWNYTPNPSTGKILEQAIGIPHKQTPPMQKILAGWKKQAPLCVIELNKKQTITHQTFIAEKGINFPFSAKQLVDISPKEIVLHTFNFKQGYLLIVGGEKLAKAQIDLMLRFTQVFQQTYTRFLDLKKAEAQAREAQIEAALEKVRSRSLAMHKPEELQEVVAVVAEKLKDLGVIFDAGGVLLCTYFPDNKDVVQWIAVDDFSSSGRYFLPYFDNPIFSEAWDSKMRGDAYFSKEFPVEAKNEFFKHAFKNSDYKQMPDDYKQFVLNANQHHLSAAWSKNSAIIIPSLTGAVPSENDAEIMKRFAKVFEQAYIRFMDLEKAEAQAREAQIEAALERVRSRAMAMRSSVDIGEATTILFEEIEKLEIETMRCGILIIHENVVMDVWTTSNTKDDKIISVSGQIDMKIHPLLKNVYRGWKAKEGYTKYELIGKDGENYYKALSKEVSYQLPTSSIIKDKHYCTCFLFNEGALFAFTKNEIPESAMNIFRRFAKVFGLTYQRYRELIESEKREKEAKKQSSLDRVRGEIASMRSTEDLNRITPIIWQELTNLGVPFFRCGVFIMNEKNENIQVYLSDPNGKSLSVMNLDFTTSDLTKNSVKAWRNNEVYKTYWDKEEFINWTKSLIDLGKIETKKEYQGGDDAPESLDLHFVPFSQGMMYVGNLKMLTEDQIALVKNLSESFSIAYSRYEDFAKLEKAKQSVETTLTELKATQNQLIQSEKMASLGELTAGIAHEIQNPLNFVNNFSEVSNELIDEMNEELDKGDLEEVKAISLDIKQNLEKINHHGKRADNIVKGMLQHSRSSSGTKEPTNINALADEYLRLAYHGLRAKDKSFNAELVTDFDEHIGKVNMIPQDMGRVILNLITNAFYAVNEKKQQKPKDYKPIVSVSTKRVGDKIEIKVTDNGNGIPKHVIDKVFQPFFTTKPTGQGTGLGLSMSYDIVTKGHGGELHVETIENERTQFNITLPVYVTEPIKTK